MGCRHAAEMKYSKKKIARFDRHKIEKTLIEFLKEIERCWDEVDVREELIRNLAQFASDAGEMLDIPDCETLDDFMRFSVPVLRRLGDEPMDMDLRILQGDGSGERKQIPLCGILHNLRSSFNVGSVFRVAECVGIEKLYLTGYTATPNNEKVRKTAMGTDDHVIWECYEDIDDVIGKLRAESIPVIALETVEDAPTIFEMDFPRPCAILIGNEAHGIDENTLKMVDRIVRIPVHGWKNSLNVGTSFAVTCYEVVRQWG